MATKGGAFVIDDDFAESNGFSAEPQFEEKPPEDEKAPPLPPYRPTPLKGKLVQFYGVIGISIFAFDKPCGAGILQNADPMAESLDKLARESPAVKRVLETLVKTGAWGTVLAAHMPILMTVGMHHGTDSVRELITRLNQAGEYAESQNQE